MTGSKGEVFRRALGAFLCLGGGIGLAQSNARLPWPPELPNSLLPQASLFVSEKSNLVLDFHGSVQDPDLVLFTAGNQYPVLPELIAAFREWIAVQPRHRDVKTERIFYATTPPGRLIDAMESGRLVLGNFWIDVRPGALWPDAFMTGPGQQRRLQAASLVDGWSVYARNRGAVLLVSRGNPKNIRGLSDLMRVNVRVALSSPDREPASFESYSSTLRAQAGPQFVDAVLKKASTISPVAVHHRENPQLICDGVADVAPMYYHLGKYLKERMPELFDYVVLPRKGNFCDALAVSTIGNSPRPAAAAAWLEFMHSDTAGAVYLRHGFNFASLEERQRKEYQ